MTELLATVDAYAREAEATVVEATETGVVLDRTPFYTGGGGQPSDTGVLRSGDKEWQVRKITRARGKLVHELDSEPPEAGIGVHCEIDWDRHYQLMRTHTALHILCGVVWRDFGAHVTGSDMKPLTARMDFELEEMTADFAEKIEDLINLEVQAARDVKIRTLPRDEAFAIPDLIRTKISLLPEGISEIRIVDIEGLDLQADGGTHVANTREVGTIKVTSHESKGRINKRLRIAVE